MQVAKVEIFFSCSFADEDLGVNAVFLAICRALGMNAGNVSTGHAKIPPEVAKEKIDASQAVIAICTRRDELKAGGFHMPQAVQDEISFAFGKDIPVLMIVEQGVSLKGFKTNFGTFLEFTRDDLSSPVFLEKAVEAIHGLRLSVLGVSEVVATYGMSEAHAEYVNHMIELRAVGGEFVWQYSTSKKLIYAHASKRGIPASFWTSTTTQIPNEAADLKWSITLDDSSRNIKLEPKILKQNPNCIEAIIKLVPTPEEGDFVEYSTVAESPYLNPVWSEDAPQEAVFHLSSGDFRCADGLVFLHRTKRAIIEFRFAKEYGLTRSDVVPFAGSYTSSLDFEVESELKRLKLRFEQFGGSLVLRMEINSPLPGHMYGLAWNPRARPREYTAADLEA